MMTIGETGNVLIKKRKNLGGCPFKKKKRKKKIKRDSNPEGFPHF